MDNYLLKKLQDTELEILLFINNFCIRHNIKYSLFAGTALGAVRHKGFIPWDDDVDIFMERMEYEKFKKYWYEEKPSGYYFQDPEVSNEPINHAKIRKDGTVFVSENTVENNEHNGIFLDIFPMDKVRDSRIAKIYMLFWGSLAIVYKRDYPTDKNGWLLHMATWMMIKLPKRIKKKILNKSNQNIQRFKSLESDFQWVNVACLEDMRYFYPQYIISDYTTISFCGYSMMINSKYKEMLELYFGDYMVLPQKEERVCKHNPKLICFSQDENVLIEKR